MRRCTTTNTSCSASSRSAGRTPRRRSTRQTNAWCSANITVTSGGAVATSCAWAPTRARSAPRSGSAPLVRPWGCASIALQKVMASAQPTDDLDLQEYEKRPGLGPACALARDRPVEARTQGRIARDDRYLRQHRVRVADADPGPRADQQQRSERLFHPRQPAPMRPDRPQLGPGTNIERDDAVGQVRTRAQPA